MGVVTRARKKRKLEEKQELVDDFISGLPDGVLRDIVTLLPTRDGARTQVLSSRWRHIWRSAPLNLDLQKPLRRTPCRDFSRVLSSHPGPCRRFTIDMRYVLSIVPAPHILEAWLQCPAFDSLQELEFHLGRPLEFPMLLPGQLRGSRRFSCTLRVASFGACSFPDGNANALHLPLLNQLSLVSVRISETSLHALLAGCSVLESLLLEDINGFPRVQIMSTSLRTIGVCSPWGDNRLRQLIIEDAPSLERLLIFKGREMDISVISAPRLHILGELQGRGQMLQFGATALQGSTIASMMTVVPSVRVLALSHMTPCLDVVFNLMKCFPLLEKLHMEVTL
ncbi:F-box/LRR-repeat protein At4g14103-like [Setaria viridis]|uniref:F-box/LRR-repeat protein At4g14103-like n=1 Tax=Setaria viridis TaxID=4556 RepID=UPI0014938288|nr:F-box/LRR-repeat protein At4g14103-like [Setaria viridis]